MARAQTLPTLVLAALAGLAALAPRASASAAAALVADGSNGTISSCEDGLAARFDCEEHACADRVPGMLNYLALIECGVLGGGEGTGRGATAALALVLLGAALAFLLHLAEYLTTKCVDR
jgi:hypothetical protein